MRTLSLTSPAMRGDDVKTAQKTLKANNAWTGKIDGIFGEVTARGCAQAKYVLGYQSKNCTRTYDAELHAYLTGRKKTTVFMQRRAKQRMSKPVLRIPALAVAQQYVGVKENPPNSNKVMFSEWYGMTGPWCMMFVTYCYTQAKAKHFNKHAARWAYCPYMYNDARAQRYGLTIIPKEKALPGDIVLFDWHDDTISDHVGMLVTKVGKYGDFKSIEGNTSLTNDSNGGEVMIRGRNVSDTIAFVRVWE